MLPSFHARLPSKEETLEKRDDDFRPARSRANSTTTSPLTPPWRWRRRRILGIVAALVLVYLFVKNMPEPLGPVNDRINPKFRPINPNFSPELNRGQPPQENSRLKWPKGFRSSKPQTGQDAPPRPAPGGDWDDKSKHYYDGPAKLDELRNSLARMASSSQTPPPPGPANKNVLYVVSSLKSAANLIPMACEMVKRRRSRVHMAFMGRETLSLEEVLKINGVDTGDCPVFFHDARADWSDFSSDQRVESAVGQAVKLLENAVRPQVFIMDDAEVEDAVFARAIRKRVGDMFRTLIEVPKGKYEEFLWMTRLDADSLAAWHFPSIDILVHAPPQTSGGILRLLKSLRDASYNGLKIPRLTIELPPDIEEPLKRYIEGLPWPPVWGRSRLESDTLMLRHRIPSNLVSPEEASQRFLESFYPAEPHDNHVLILSPQAELSPTYLQYLHYTILEYRYSGSPSLGGFALFGISLDVPSHTLNGTERFTQPLLADMKDDRFKDAKTSSQDSPSHFLYQAPTSTASLIFGDKWASFHDFLSNRMTISHTTSTPVTKSEHIIPKTEPSWLEHLLELMRARGWYNFHPSTPFVTTHAELAQVPEEFLSKPQNKKKPSKPSPESDDPTSPTPEDPQDSSLRISRKLPLSKRPLHHPPESPILSGNQHIHQLLPLDGTLPDLHNLPFVPFQGSSAERKDISLAAKEKQSYVPNFRQEIGGCSEEDAKKRRQTPSDGISTRDLFCFAGEEVVDEVGAEDEITEQKKGGEGDARPVTEDDLASALARLIPGAVDDYEAGEDGEWVYY